MTFKNFIAPLAALSVLLAACGPRDQKINRPDTGAGAGSLAAGAPEAKYDNYKYVALLADRQIEALELYKALQNPEFAAQRQFSLTGNSDAKGPGRTAVAISRSPKNKDLVEAATARSINLIARQTNDADGKLQEIVIENNPISPSFEKVIVQGQDLVVNNKSKKITMTASADGSIAVSFFSADQLNSKSMGKAAMFNTVEFIFTENTAGETFEVSKVVMRHERYASQNADFAMVSDAASKVVIEMKKDQACATVVGHLNMNSIELKKGSTAPLYSNQLTFATDKMNIVAGVRTNVNFPVAACEQRSVVDLTKIF